MCLIVANIANWANREPMSDFANYLELNEMGLIKKINMMGFEIKSVWKDLVNPRPDISEKLHVIINILTESVDDNNLHPRIISGIVRAIGNKNIVEKHDLYDFLVKRYKSIPPSTCIKNPQARELDQSFASSISNHMKIYYLDRYTNLLFEDSLGDSRLLLLDCLSSFSGNSDVFELLNNIKSHPLYSKEARMILRKFKK